MEIEEILGEKREEILRIATKHGVTSIAVFGSSRAATPVQTAMSISSSKRVPT